MSRIQSIGPATPSNDPRGVSSLRQAIETYTHLLSHPNPDNTRELENIAQKTVELSTLAKSVMHAASPALRQTADDLENLLKSPLAVTGMPKEISILTASEHYLNDPATAELGPLVQELCHNNLALGLMCNELTLLSNSIKNPNALGA